VSRQRGQALIILAVIVVFVFVAGLLAIYTPGEDDHSLGRIQLVSHERSRCEDECDRGDYRRGCDEYGCYEDGPPDDDRRGGKQTCFMACYITVPGVPGMGGDRPPPEERAALGCAVPVPFHCDPRPASLFPPTPAKIIQGIQVMGDAGIKLGSTIAQLVIDYVVTVFRFVV
jgi:hypothetical protein